MKTFYLKIIVIFLILGLFLPNSSFTLNLQITSAQTNYPGVAIPETPEEIKTAGERALSLLPEFAREIWRQVSEYFQTLWKWFKSIWGSYIWPFIRSIWRDIWNNKILPFFQRKIEEKIEKQKEEIKEEIKTEIPKATETIWRKFKELTK